MSNQSEFSSYCQFWRGSAQETAAQSKTTVAFSRSFDIKPEKMNTWKSIFPNQQPVVFSLSFFGGWGSKPPYPPSMADNPPTPSACRPLPETKVLVRGHDPSLGPSAKSSKWKKLLPIENLSDLRMLCGGNEDSQLISRDLNLLEGGRQLARQVLEQTSRGVKFSGYHGWWKPIDVVAESKQDNSWSK